MTPTSNLFTPILLGRSHLKHRLVFAPSEGPLDCYTQRATEGGLIIFSPDVQNSEGLASSISADQQKEISNLVHAKGGTIFKRLRVPEVATKDASNVVLEGVHSALVCNFDGVELEIEPFSIQGNTHEGLVKHFDDLIHVATENLGQDRCGLRLSPFVDGPTTYSLSDYVYLVSHIHATFENLAFIHVVDEEALVEGSTIPESLADKLDRLDIFRAIVAHPRTVGHTDSEQRATRFIASARYTPGTADAIISRSGGLIALNRTFEVNPDLVSRLSSRTLLRDDPTVATRDADIDREFQGGKEYIFKWTSPQQRSRVFAAMQAFDDHLTKFDPALSYEGTDQRVVWRKSCWFATPGLFAPFLTSEEAIAQFDGDLKDGQTGLAALKAPGLRQHLEYLKSVIDASLVATARAVGIDDTMIARCTVRYRIISYCAHAGSPGGIGLHPDGNALSSLITNGPGLSVFDLDGVQRDPGYEGIILMPGSTLYRWSNGKYIPTFHDVAIGKNQRKASIVGFFNFPDMTAIPRSLGMAGDTSAFAHDIKKIKLDDKSPQGELADLWTVIIQNHKLVLPPVRS